MNKKIGLSLLALVLAASLSACGGKEQTQGKVTEPAKATANQGDKTAGDAAEAPSKKTAYPLTVKDASGQDITFSKAPERIVSLSPSETEVLFALGLGDQIVGDTQYCDYPEEAKSKPKIGSLEVDNEAVLAAKPDAVFGGLTMNKKSVDTLRGLGLTVFTVEPKTLDDVFDRILLYGKITDKQEQAEKLVAAMKEERKQVTDAVAKLKPEEKKKVYIEFSPGWTVGSGEFMDELVATAGGINVAADQKGWYQISEEKVIQSNPDVILFSNGVEKLESTIKGRSGWSNISAIKNGKMAGLDDNLISRPGPRLTKALHDVAKAMYPDLVK